MKATNPIDDYKNKHVVYAHGKRITVLVNPIEEILYKLRPKLDHETGKDRVNKVAQARLDLYAAITSALPQPKEPKRKGVVPLAVYNGEQQQYYKTILAFKALFDIGGEDEVS